MTLKYLGQSTLPSSKHMFLLSSEVSNICQESAPRVSNKQTSFQDMKFAFHKYFAIGTQLLKYLLKVSTGRTGTQ